MSLEPREYTVTVTTELVEQYTAWTRIQDLPAVWFKVIPNEDGTAEVWFNDGEERLDDV